MQTTLLVSRKPHGLRPMLSMFGLLTVLLGGVYPLTITLMGQAFFPEQVQGQWVADAKGNLRGSALIGQSFTRQEYLWGRPSANQYDAMASGGSNLGLLNPIWLEQQRERLAILQQAHPQQTAPVPTALLQASASGLDPDLPLQAALWQAPRVAQVRGISVQQVVDLIEQQTQHHEILGQTRVNVLAFNLALDQHYPMIVPPVVPHHAAP